MNLFFWKVFFSPNPEAIQKGMEQTWFVMDWQTDSQL